MEVLWRSTVPHWYAMSEGNYFTIFSFNYFVWQRVCGRIRNFAVMGGVLDVVRKLSIVVYKQGYNS